MDSFLKACGLYRKEEGEQDDSSRYKEKLQADLQDNDPRNVKFKIQHKGVKEDSKIFCGRSYYSENLQSHFPESLKNNFSDDFKSFTPKSYGFRKRSKSVNYTDGPEVFPEAGDNKKYHSIKSKQGVQTVSTSFQDKPLLPKLIIQTKSRPFSSCTTSKLKDMSFSIKHNSGDKPKTEKNRPGRPRKHDKADTRNKNVAKGKVSHNTEHDKTAIPKFVNTFKVVSPNSENVSKLKSIKNEVSTQRAERIRMKREQRLSFEEKITEVERERKSHLKYKYTKYQLQKAKAFSSCMSHTNSSTHKGQRSKTHMDDKFIYLSKKEKYLSCGPQSHECGEHLKRKVKDELKSSHKDKLPPMDSTGPVQTSNQNHVSSHSYPKSNAHKHTAIISSKKSLYHKTLHPTVESSSAAKSTRNKKLLDKKFMSHCFNKHYRLKEWKGNNRACLRLLKNKYKSVRVLFQKIPVLRLPKIVVGEEPLKTTGIFEILAEEKLNIIPDRQTEIEVKNEDTESLVDPRVISLSKTLQSGYNGKVGLEKTFRKWGVKTVKPPESFSKSKNSTMKKTGPTNKPDWSKLKEKLKEVNGKKILQKKDGIVVEKNLYRNPIISRNPVNAQSGFNVSKIPVNCLKPVKHGGLLQSSKSEKDVSDTRKVEMMSNASESHDLKLMLKKQSDPFPDESSYYFDEPDDSFEDMDVDSESVANFGFKIGGYSIEICRDSPVDEILDVTDSSLLTNTLDLSNSTTDNDNGNIMELPRSSDSRNPSCFRNNDSLISIFTDNQLDVDESSVGTVGQTVNSGDSCALTVTSDIIPNLHIREEEGQDETADCDDLSPPVLKRECESGDDCKIAQIDSGCLDKVNSGLQGNSITQLESERVIDNNVNSEEKISEGDASKVITTQTEKNENVGDGDGYEIYQNQVDENLEFEEICLDLSPNRTTGLVIESVCSLNPRHMTESFYGNSDIQFSDHENELEIVKKEENTTDVCKVNLEAGKENSDYYNDENEICINSLTNSVGKDLDPVSKLKPDNGNVKTDDKISFTGDDKTSNITERTENEKMGLIELVSETVTVDVKKDQDIAYEDDLLTKLLQEEAFSDVTDINKNPSLEEGEFNEYNSNIHGECKDICQKDNGILDAEITTDNILSETSELENKEYKTPDEVKENIAEGIIPEVQNETNKTSGGGTNNAHNHSSEEDLALAKEKTDKAYARLAEETDMANTDLVHALSEKESTGLANEISTIESTALEENNKENSDAAQALDEKENSGLVVEAINKENAYPVKETIVIDDDMQITVLAKTVTNNIEENVSLAEEQNTTEDVGIIIETNNKEIIDLDKEINEFEATDLAKELSDKETCRKENPDVNEHDMVPNFSKDDTVSTAEENGKDRLQKMFKRRQKSSENQSISDEDLPKILPPKRRQRASQHHPQSDSKMNSDLTAERLMQDLPNHNWLFNKYSNNGSQDGKQKVASESSPKEDSPAKLLKKSKKDIQMMDLSWESPSKKPFFTSRATNQQSLLMPNSILQSAEFIRKSTQYRPNNFHFNTRSEKSSTQFNTVSSLNEQVKKSEKQSFNYIKYQEIDDSSLGGKYKQDTCKDENSFPIKQELHCEVCKKMDNINGGYDSQKHVEDFEGGSQHSGVNHNCACSQNAVYQSKQSNMDDSDAGYDGVDPNQTDSSEQSNIDTSTDRLEHLDNSSEAKRDESSLDDIANDETGSENKELNAESLKTDGCKDAEKPTNETIVNVDILTMVAEKSSALDLCVSKLESGSVNFKPRANPPVQLVHPQVYKPQNNLINVDQPGRQETIAQANMQKNEDLLNASVMPEVNIKTDGAGDLPQRVRSGPTPENEIQLADEVSADRREIITSDIGTVPDVHPDTISASNASDKGHDNVSENKNNITDKTDDFDVGKRMGKMRKTNTVEVPPVPALVSVTSVGRGVRTAVIPVQPIVQLDHNLQNSPVHAVGPFQSCITTNGPVQVQTVFITHQSSGQIRPLQLQTQATNQSSYRPTAFQPGKCRIVPKTSLSSHVHQTSTDSEHNPMNITCRRQGQVQGQVIQGQLVQVNYEGMKPGNIPPPLLYQQPQIIQVQPQSFNQNPIQGINSSSFVRNEISSNIYNQTGQVFTLNESNSAASFGPVQSLSQVHQGQNIPQTIRSSNDLNTAEVFSSPVGPPGQVSSTSHVQLAQTHTIKTTATEYSESHSLISGLEHIAKDNDSSLVLNESSGETSDKNTNTLVSNTTDIKPLDSVIVDKDNQTDTNNTIKTEDTKEEYYDGDDDEIRKKMQEIDEEIKRKEMEQEHMRKIKLELMQKMKLSKCPVPKSATSQNVLKTEILENHTEEPIKKDTEVDTVFQGSSEDGMESVAKQNKTVRTEDLLIAAETEIKYVLSQENESALHISDAEQVNKLEPAFKYNEDNALDLSSPAKAESSPSKIETIAVSVPQLEREVTKDPVLSSALNESLDLTTESSKFIIDTLEMSGQSDEVKKLDMESSENPDVFDLPDHKDKSMEFIEDIGVVNLFTGEYESPIEDRGNETVQQSRDDESLDLTIKSVSNCKNISEEETFIKPTVEPKDDGPVLFKTDNSKSENNLTIKASPEMLENKKEVKSKSLDICSKLDCSEPFMGKTQYVDSSSSLDLSMKKDRATESDEQCLKKPATKTPELRSKRSSSLPSISGSPLAVMSSDITMVTTKTGILETSVSISTIDLSLSRVPEASSVLTFQRFSQSDVITPSIACSAVSALVNKTDKNIEYTSSNIEEQGNSTKDSETETPGLTKGSNLYSNADKLSCDTPKTEAEIIYKGMQAISMTTASCVAMTIGSSPLSNPVTSQIIQDNNPKILDTLKSSYIESGSSLNNRNSLNQVNTAQTATGVNRHQRLYDSRRSKSVSPNAHNINKSTDALVHHTKLSSLGILNIQPTVKQNQNIERRLQELQNNNILQAERLANKGMYGQSHLYKIHDPQRGPRSRQDATRRHKSRLVELLPAHYKHPSKKIPKGTRPVTAHGNIISIKHIIKKQTKTMCDVPSCIQQSCPYITRNEGCHVSPTETETACPKHQENKSPPEAHSQETFGIASPLITRSEKRKRNISGEALNYSPRKVSSVPNTPTDAEQIMPRSSSASAVLDTVVSHTSQNESPDHSTMRQAITPPIIQTNSAETINFSPIRAHCKPQSLMANNNISLTQVLHPPGFEEERSQEGRLNSADDNVEVIDLTSEPLPKRKKSNQLIVIEDAEKAIQKELTAAMAKRQKQDLETEQNESYPPPSVMVIPIPQQQPGRVEPVEREVVRRRRRTYTRQPPPYSQIHAQKYNMTNQNIIPNITMQKPQYDRRKLASIPQGFSSERHVVEHMNHSSSLKDSSQHVGAQSNSINLSQPPMLVSANNSQNMFRVVPPDIGRIDQSKLRVQGHGSRSQDFQQQEMNMQPPPELMQRCPVPADQMHRPRHQINHGSITHGIAMSRQYNQQEYSGAPTPPRVNQSSIPGYQLHQGTFPGSYPTSGVMQGYPQRSGVVPTSSPNSKHVPGMIQPRPGLMPPTSPVSGVPFQQRPTMMPGMMPANSQNPENLHQLLQQPHPRMQPIATARSPSNNMQGLQRASPGDMQSMTPEQKIRMQKMQQVRAQHIRSQQARNQQLAREQGVRMAAPAMVQHQEHQMQGTRMPGPSVIPQQQHHMQGTRISAQHMMHGTKITSSAVLQQQQHSMQGAMPEYIQEGTNPSNIQTSNTQQPELHQQTTNSQYRAFQITQEHLPCPVPTARTSNTSAAGYQQDGQMGRNAITQQGQQQQIATHQIPAHSRNYQGPCTSINQSQPRLLSNSNTTSQYMQGQDSMQTNIQGQGPQMQMYQGNSGPNQGTATGSQLPGNQPGIYVPVQVGLHTTPIEIQPVHTSQIQPLQQPSCHISDMATIDQQRSQESQGSNIQQQQQQQTNMEEMEKTMPHLQQIHGACIMCGKYSLYLCSSCKKIWYCSPHCQLTHWQTHVNECLGEAT